MLTGSFEYIRRLLLQKSAIALDASKAYLVEVRLSPLLKKYGLKSIDDLVVKLQTAPHSQLTEDVLNAMTTNETSFFRDVAPFETLRTLVLPKLFRCRVAARRLNIWSAACSTGQEPYSIAMLLRQHFPGNLGWDIRLLGSDLSTQALSQAKDAIYSDMEIQRGLHPSLLARFARPHTSGWQLVQEIRSMVEFRFINLVEDWPPLPRMDAIFLRNVLVYFDEETKRQMLRRIRVQLKPDGFLFLGGAETTVHLDRSFQQFHANGSSYYQPRNKDARRL